MSTSPASKSADNASLIALVLVVFVAMTGFGLFIPIFPFIGLYLGATATEITIAMSAYSVGQLVAAPLWGRLSDRIGRKPVLILGLFGAAISYASIAFATSIEMMGAARLFGGLMAGNIGAAFAAAADLADDKTRARNMGLLGAAFGFGFIVGPGVGALAVGQAPTWEDFQRVCLCAAGFALAAGIAAAVLMRETAPLGQDRPIGTKSISLSQLRQRPILAQLVLAMFLLITAQAMMESIFAIWADLRIGWSVRDVGVLLASVGLITALIQGGATGALARRFGERGLFAAGIAASIAGYLICAHADGASEALVGLTVLSVGAGLASPALQSMIAAQAAPSERGTVLGASQSASAFGRAVGGVCAGPLFDGFGAAAPFLFGAFLLALAFFPVFSAKAQALKHSP